MRRPARNPPKPDGQPSVRPIQGLYSLSPKAIWTQFRTEHFSFWMVCMYLLVEYVRPQAIIPRLEFLPWEKLFVGLTAVGLLSDPERRWVRDPANVWMTLFGATLIASSLLAEFPAESWAHWFDFFGWYAIYFLIINTVTTAERYFIFLGIFLLASFKLSFFGARVWVSRGFGFRNWGIMGPPGDFQNSGELSIQMLMFWPIAYELGLFLKPHIHRVKFWLLMSLPVTAAMTVMGASSRGGQIGLGCQVLLGSLRKKLNLKVLVAIVLAAWIGYSLLPDAQKVRFTHIGQDRSSEQRIYYWKAGIQMIRDHPVLGVGFFNFPLQFAAHHPREILYGEAQLPHNIFIQVGTDAGLLGLGIFVMLIYRNLKAASEIRRMCRGDPTAPAFASAAAAGLATAAWGFVVAGQFVTVTYYPFFWINLALTVSLKNIVARSVGQAALVERLPRRKRVYPPGRPLKART